MEMEFPITGNISIGDDNNMDFPDMAIDELTSINIDELMASIDQEDINQFQESGIIDPINVQLDNTPTTLNGVLEEIQPDQTQVQAPQCPISLPNIDHQSLAQPESSDEMTLEEFLINLGVIRAPSPVVRPQLEVKDHDGLVLGANNPIPELDTGGRENGYDFPFGGSAGPCGPTVIGIPVSYGWNMTPISVSSNESNRIVQSPTSTMVTHNARQRRRMIRARLRHQENNTKCKSRGTSSRTT